MGILIQSVTPADVNGAAIGVVVTNVPAPSGYRWGKLDLSASKAGRTEAYNMIKMKAGEVRTLNLQWSGLSYAKTSTVLKAFNHEYIKLSYYDFLTGANATKHFYCGDMSAESFTATNGGVTQIVTVPLVQASPDMV